MERRSITRHFLLLLLSCAWKIFTHIPPQRRLQMRLSAACLWSQLQTKAEVTFPFGRVGGRWKTFSQFSSPFCAPGFPSHSSSKTCGISQNTDVKRDFEHCYSQDMEGDKYFLHLSLFGSRELRIPLGYLLLCPKTLNHIGGFPSSTFTVLGP